jgi:transposase
MLVREKNVSALDSWLAAARASGLPTFVGLANGLEADRAAVEAGLSLPWSSGPVEGNINRLKLIKRQGYGRAKFDLLRLRVLAA